MRISDRIKRGQDRAKHIAEGTEYGKNESFKGNLILIGIGLLVLLAIFS